MELFFSPLACSLASRIAFYEAGAAARYREVDPKTKRILDTDEPFVSVNPLQLVPTLRMTSGEVLTENAAILQHIAEVYPEAQLAPTSGIERTRLQEWLCFIGTELHKGLFVTLLDKKAPDAMKQYVLQKHRSRMEHLDRRLQGREYVLERFSVADAYLFVVLNWSVVTPVKLADYPAVHAYHERLRKRPSIARAVSEELVLFRDEQARHAQAS